MRRCGSLPRVLSRVNDIAAWSMAANEPLGRGFLRLISMWMESVLACDWSKVKSVYPVRRTSDEGLDMPRPFDVRTFTCGEIAIVIESFSSDTQAYPSLTVPE